MPTLFKQNAFMRIDIKNANLFSVVRFIKTSSKDWCLKGFKRRQMDLQNFLKSMQNFIRQ